MGGLCAYVYASTISPRMDNGCVGYEQFECQVWYVTSDGVGMVLERGKNFSYVDEEPDE